jgi:heme/copper-type cytochrome/quinol oxidase subunit 3
VSAFFKVLAGEHAGHVVVGFGVLAIKRLQLADGFVARINRER